MREAMWGIFILILGAIGIVAVNLFQDLTITNDQTHYLLKETTKAAMGDSIDISYYRATGRLRIVESKFVENLTRRFAESATVNKDYNIIIHDVVEEPPKVSISMMTNADDLSGKKYEIFERIDSIYEAVYKSDLLYDSKDFEDSEYIPGAPGKVPEDPYKDGKCMNSEIESNVCLLGDLTFDGWGDAPLFLGEQCPDDLIRLTSKDRDAYYKECICDSTTNKVKWSDRLTQVISSGRPTISSNKATYKWTFIKDGPFNDINSTTSTEVVAGICGTIKCTPDELITILKNQTVTLTPVYTPDNSINRDIEWTSQNNRVTLIDQNPPIIFPKVDTVSATGRSVGSDVITGRTKAGSATDTCRITVTTCDDVLDMELGKTYNVKLKTGSLYLTSDLKYNVSDPTIARINNRGEITPIKEGSTRYSIDPSGIKGDECTLTVKSKPSVHLLCPNPMLEMTVNSSANAYLTDRDNKAYSGNVATWSLSSSAPNVTVSSSGEISTGNTGYNEIYYKAVLKDGYVNGNDTSKNSIECPFKVIEAEKYGCTVGNIWASWGNKTLPDLCENDIVYKTQNYNSAVAMSVTPVFCGFTGYIGGCGNGIVSTMNTTTIRSGSSSTPSDAEGGKSISATIGSSTYQITWSIFFRYNGWNDASIDNCIKNRYTTNAPTLTRTGKLKPKTDPSCQSINSSTNTISIVEPSSGSAELMVGSKGGMRLVASATFANLPDGQKAKTESDITWEIARGPGSLSKTKGKEVVYNPPSKYDKEKTVVIISAKHPHDGILGQTTPPKAAITINLLELVNCDYLRLKGDRICVDVPTTFNLVFDDTNYSYNQNAEWSYEGGITSTSGNRSILGIFKGVTAGSKYKITAYPQVGKCTETTSNIRTLSNTVKASVYRCNGEDSWFFPNILDKYCYNRLSSKSPICPEQYLYNSLTNKCEKYSCLSNYILQKDGLCHLKATPTCPTGFSTNSTYGCSKATDKERKCPSGWKEEYGSYCTKAITYTDSCTSGFEFDSSGSYCIHSLDSSCTTETKNVAECPKGRTCSTTTSSTVCAKRGMDAPCYSYNIRTCTGCSSGTKTKVSGSYKCVSSDRLSTENDCPTGSSRTWIAPSGGPWKCNTEKTDQTKVPASCSVGELKYIAAGVSICISAKTNCASGYTYDSANLTCSKNEGIKGNSITASSAGCDDGSYPFKDTCKTRVPANASCN